MALNKFKSFVISEKLSFKGSELSFRTRAEKKLHRAKY